MASHVRRSSTSGADAPPHFNTRIPTRVCTDSGEDRLFQLHTGWVAGYTERQDPLVYLVSTAQAVQQSGAGFVFSDGHGIAVFTSWFDNLGDLDKVDWEAAYATIWRDTVDDMDRQRRKQAELLVHHQCDWALIQEIAVVNHVIKSRVEEILAEFPAGAHRPVQVRPEWYY